MSAHLLRRLVSTSPSGTCQHAPADASACQHARAQGPSLVSILFSEVQPPPNSCQVRSFFQAGSAHRWPFRNLPGNVRRAAEASAVEEGQVQLVEALGIGDRVDLDDLAAPDLEVQHHKEPSTRSHYDPHGAVDERRSRGPGASY